MTKRLYFTCPIKALYMMKEFMVKFEWKQRLKPTDDNWKPYQFNDWGKTEIPYSKVDDYIKYSIECDENRDRIYVAPESERIFELQKEDLVNYKCESISKWELQIQGMNSPKIYKDAREFLIIMRDNKQFFMPEVENER